MTSTYVFVVLIVSVGALVFMVSKLKFHAVLALYLASLMLALLVGTPIEKIPKMINTGFGNTCKSVALVIFLGSLLGIILNKTGAIVKLMGDFTHDAAVTAMNHMFAKKGESKFNEANAMAFDAGYNAVEAVAAASCVR